MRQIPTKRVNPTLVLVMYFLFKSLPLALSAFSIYLGYRLFILGVTGEASLSLATETVSGQLLNAAPGLFFAIGGLVTAIVSAYRGVDLHFRDDIGD